MVKTLAAFLLALTLGFSGVAQANDKITICHHTSSKTNPTVTITVSENAWKAHEKHGDTRGPCPSATTTPKPTQSAVPTGTSAPTAKPTGTPNATGNPSAGPTSKPTSAPVVSPAPTKAPTTGAPAVKQLPSTATERNSVPYDPGFDD